MGISALARWEHAFKCAARCAECGCDDLGVDDDLGMEAFDYTGEIVCDTCAEQIVEANGQFGVGA